MFDAIQRAYYQQGRNPSNNDVLVEIAGEIEPALDADRFAKDLVSLEIEALMQDGFNVRRSMNAKQFPSLVMREGEAVTFITKGYDSKESVLARLQASLMI